MCKKLTMSQLSVILVHCILCILQVSHHRVAGQNRQPPLASVSTAPALNLLHPDLPISNINIPHQDPPRAGLATHSNPTQGAANLRPRSSNGDNIAIENLNQRPAINQGVALIGVQVSSRNATPSSAGKLLAGGLSSQQNQQLQAASNWSTSLANVRQSWRQMEQSLASAFSVTSFNLKQALDELLTTSNKINSSSNGNRRPVPVVISAQCKSALNELFEGLSEQELWASQMLDSSALRLPSGVLEGTLTELGHFDECLAISHTRHKSPSPGGAASQPGGSNQPISGQYCSLHIRPPLINRPRLHTVCRRLPNLSSATFAGGNSSSGGDSLPLVKMLAQNSQQFLYVGLRLGICTPNKCSQADVQQVLAAYLAKYELIGQVKYCQQLDRRAPQSKLDSDSSQIFGYLLQAYRSSSVLQKFDPVQQCIL